MEHVTIEEQIKMGIRQPARQLPANYVQGEIVQRPRVEVLPPINTYDMQVTPTGTTHVDMRTSAQDRAWGFLIASTPRTFVFALAITLISMLATDMSVLVGIVMLVSIFAVVELASYVFTLAISAEGTAHYEARQKWAIIKEEQRARWKHYNRLNGGDNDG